MPAGYSNTPLIKKLGIKEEMKVLLMNQPDDYYSLLGKNINEQLCDKNEIPDIIHLFTKNNNEFERCMKKIASMLKKNNSMTIWVSWYKKVSGFQTDLTEDIIRKYALQNDLVDVKVCAVSDFWSGLKLVVPLKKRS